ncbi:hypothetical protein GLYMA_12G234033v4 [Glycine max]|nr:hypothetical protein GLYMA_12G234033v4 [Glycine max]KAH1144596.1 hypothetical protein GYH30_034703 [Glycine max]
MLIYLIKVCIKILVMCLDFSLKPSNWKFNSILPLSSFSV